MKLPFLPCLLATAMVTFVSGIRAADVKAAPAAAPPPPSIETLRDPEIVGTFSAMPVQANGRVKPLDTVARFTLLRMYGKQSLKAATLDDATGEDAPVVDPVTGNKLVDGKGKPLKLSAVEWLLITWFRPETAKALPVFIVDNSDVVVLLGQHGRGKRDRYSYNDISGARDALMEKMKVIRELKESDRSIEDRALGKLAVDFLDYEMMLSHLDFARAPFGNAVGSLPPELAVHVRDGNTDWAALLPEIGAYFKSHPEAAAPMSNPWLLPFYRSMFGARMSGDPATLLRIFPPADKGVEEWHGPGTVLEDALIGGKPTADDYANLSRYGSLVSASANVDAFKAKAKEVVGAFTQAAAARGESGHIGLEIRYQRADYFINALYLYIFGVVLCVAYWILFLVNWLSPGRKLVSWTLGGLKWLCIAAAVGGVALGVTGIVTRCIIMERPPITNLYETIIFIGTACVLFGLAAEALTRMGLAMVVANLAGMAGMFLSIRFMDMEARDTMQQLEAVLITNFWLSTHVPCINLGYAAGMMACLFSMLYLFLRATTLVKAGSTVARILGILAYAFILLGLFLSLVGTVLGGIWANYSWGRFWGWDPKENGALMIVLMNLIILHARLGNYIREVGFHTVNVLLGMVTLFSWFATNQLGIGLHAYGELNGAWRVLYITWAIMLVFLLFGIILAQVDKWTRRRRPRVHVEPSVLGAPQKA